MGVHGGKNLPARLEAAGIVRGTATSNAVEAISDEISEMEIELVELRTVVQSQAKLVREHAKSQLSGLAKKLLATLSAALVAITGSVALIVVDKINELAHQNEERIDRIGGVTSDLKTQLKEESVKQDAKRAESRAELEAKLRALDAQTDDAAQMAQEAADTAEEAKVKAKKPGPVGPAGKPGRVVAAPTAKPSPSAPAPANGVTKVICTLNPRAVGC